MSKSRRFPDDADLLSISNQRCLFASLNSPPLQLAFINLSLLTNPQSFVRVEAIYSPFDKGGRGDFKNRNPPQEIPPALPPFPP